MTAASTYRLDDLRIDLERQRVERDGVVLDVAGLSFQLLRFLLEAGDRVVGFDALIAGVWAPAVVNEETVTQRVKLLRQALGDDGRNPRYIRSVRGRGYQLCSVPRLETTPADTVSVVRRAAPRARAVAGIAIVTVVALGAYALYAARARVPVMVDARLERARYYAGIGQAENNDRAIALYEDVLIAAPRDVAATLGLSHALSARMCLYNASPESAERARELARRVLATTPDNALAHAALAYADDCRGEVDAAIGEYERAVALDPAGRDDARASAANLYVERGRLADALAANVVVERNGTRLRFLDLQIARNLDLLGFAAAAERRYARIFELYPDNVFGNVAYPRFLFTQGRYAEAEAALASAKSRPLHPQAHLLAGELALIRGDRAGALAAFEQASSLRPHQSLPRALADLYAATPDWPTLARRADEIARDADVGPDSWIEVALLRVQDHAGAIDALRRAVAGGFRDAAWLRASPLFRPFADDPGFAEVVDAIGRAVVAERDKVLAAPWLPADLLNAASATP